ncbi:hypothetical protein GN316_18480 [Xylophilus sp. Kf1]|nr:hypothetical protein [Xylophilus sp. Kf1]
MKLVKSEICALPGGFLYEAAIGQVRSTAKSKQVATRGMHPLDGLILMKLILQMIFSSRNDSKNALGESNVIMLLGNEVRQ